MSTITVTCARCGRTAETIAKAIPSVPEGWEGSINDAVCPGCQFAEWHPHCTSLVTWGWDDEDAPYPRRRVNPAVDWAHMPREEWDFNALTYCEYIDASISVTDDDPESEWSQEWRCPQCGGTDFEWVHRDYPPSGLQSGTFRAELGDAGDDE